MKNYLRHNFRGHYRSGRPRISVIDQKHDIKCPSDFVTPLKSIISAYIPEKYRRFTAAIVQTNEKEKKTSSWLDNFFWTHQPVNFMKGDHLESGFAPFKDSGHTFKFGSHLKKYFSAYNIFDRNYISFNKENHKSAENIGPNNSFNFKDPLKQIKLTTKLNPFVPSVTKKCSDHGPYLNCKRARSHSNHYFRDNFLRPANDILDNGSRSFTTLGSKLESTKPIIPNPLNFARNLQRSSENIALLADSGQMASKAIERDSSNALEKLRKRDFDWMNSFSSEALILQPSRGEFSIKKLINKTSSQERLWGLPPRQNYAKTLGPRMNDSLIQYTALKHKIQSGFKNNNLIDGGVAANQKIKKLIKSAQEKNRLTNKKLDKKIKNISTKYTAKNMLKTIKDSINLKPVDILKTKEKIARNNEPRHFQKAQKKRSILNFRLPNLKIKEKQKNLLQMDEPTNKPTVTEYQSSASYKHVFQELFNKASKTKVPPKPAISFFNRQNTSQNFPQSVRKLSYDNLVRKKKVLKKRERSSSVPERNRTVDLKNQARTPFQKPSNTQLTSKSKASFSTVSKIPKINEPPAVSKPKLFKNSKNLTLSPKVETSERSISTNQKEKEGNKPVIKRTLYSTLGYYPAVSRRIDMKPKKKLKNKKKDTIRPNKNETKKENLSHIQSSNSNSGFFNQRRSLSSFGVQIGNIMETDESIKTLTEPLNEEVFKEVMSLCKGPPATEKKTPSSEKQKLLKNYDRCSVEEKKKPERRRGFVCRIASMLNIGCGRRRRHNQGCQECGKKAG